MSTDINPDILPHSTFLWGDNQNDITINGLGSTYTDANNKQLQIRNTVFGGKDFACQFECKVIRDTREEDITLSIYVSNDSNAYTTANLVTSLTLNTYSNKCAMYLNKAYTKSNTDYGTTNLSEVNTNPSLIYHDIFNGLSLQFKVESLKKITYTVTNLSEDSRTVTFSYGNTEGDLIFPRDNYTIIITSAPNNSPVYITDLKLYDDYIGISNTNLQLNPTEDLASEPMTWLGYPMIAKGYAGYINIYQFAVPSGAKPLRDATPLEKLNTDIMADNSGQAGRIYYTNNHLYR